eukprot:5113487-Amphidinium_carterae.1
MAKLGGNLPILRMSRLDFGHPGAEIGRVQVHEIEVRDKSSEAEAARKWQRRGLARLGTLHCTRDVDNWLEAGSATRGPHDPTRWDRQGPSLQGIAP